MQAIVVDDQEEFASKLGSQIREQEPEANVVQIPIEAEQSPRKIAAEVARQTGFESTVVFINANLRCKDNARQNQAGVEVLKFLRLTERFDEVERPTPHPEEPGNSARNAHCILYSFQSVEYLLRERPSSLIICSDGVTFERLPSDFSELDLRALTRKTASPDDLDEFLRGEFTLPDERHSWANWWGLKQLHDVHRLVTDAPDLDYPEVVKKKLTGLQATEGASIYGSKKSELESELGGRLEEQIEDVRETLREREIKIGHIDDRWNEGWSEILVRMIYPGQSFRVGKNSLQDSSRPFANYLIGEDEKVLFRSLKVFGDAEVNGGVGDERIDEAYEGITEAFEHAHLDIDLILLDLRLFGERKSRHKVSDLSGAKLLRRLRERFKGVPVIMTTASNKAWSYQKLVQVGADGYWIKEGLDERRGAEGTIGNYLELLKLVETATGEKYQFLRRFGKAFDNLKRKDELWWEDYKWKDEKTGNISDKNPRTKEVFSFIEESLLMLRSYLRQYEMGYDLIESTNRRATPDKITLWSVIQHLGKTLEEIHRWDELPKRDQNSGIIGGYIEDGQPVDRRKDWFGFRLYSVRNDASHLGSARHMQWDGLRSFVSNLLAYLEYGPQDQFQKQGRGIPKLNEMRKGSENCGSSLYEDRFNEIFHGE